MMEADMDTTTDAVVQREILSTTSLLTGGLAHEINNALIPLLSSLSLLSDIIPADPSSPAREELTAAQDAAGHIASLVRDVQALLRAERRAALIDPRVSVERALRFARRSAEGVAALRADLEEVPRVRGSDAWFTQIALNLILNAIEACRARAPRSGHVTVALRPDGDAVALVVSDDGIGMEAEQAERIFRTIVSARPPSGSGQGMVIACRLVSAMRGVIEFDSERGRGTTFRVRLPVARDLP
jgi:signal transduction histidine kinase